MKNRTLGTIAIAVMTAALLPLSGLTASAADHPPLTPEYAAKKENHRKQKEQQHISQDKRQAAADNLKAERIRVYNAKQAAKGGQPHDPAAGKHNKKTK